MRREELSSVHSESTVGPMSVCMYQVYMVYVSTCSVGDINASPPQIAVLFCPLAT